MAHRRTCALVGDAPLLLYCGEVILARGHAVVAVVTTDPGVRRWAADRGLTLLSDEDDVGAFFKDGIDLLFEVGYSRVIPPSWTEKARDAIRFHAGPLPQYAGHHPTTWALLNGESEHGVAWHIIGGRGHGGPVVASMQFEIEPGETTGELDARCREAGAQSFDVLFDALDDNRLMPRPQVGRRQWYSEHRSPPAAGVLDWRRPAAALVRMVRALCGARRSPIAWASMAIGRDAVVVERASVEAYAAPAEPGTVLRIDESVMVVAAGADAVRIKRIWRQDGLGLRFTDLPVSAGEQLPLPPLAALEALDGAWRPDTMMWTRRLADAEPLPPPFGERGPLEAGGQLPRVGADEVEVVTAALVLLARAADRYRFDVAVTEPGRFAAVGALDAWFAPYVPLRVTLDPAADFAVQVAELRPAWREAQRSGHRRDLAARLGRRRGAVVGAVLVAKVDDARRFVPPREVQTACIFDGRGVRWWAPASILGPLERGFAALLAARTEATPIARLPLLTASDRARLEATWLPLSEVTPIRLGDAVLGRAACTPDVAALTVGDRSLTYAQLERRVNRLARHLVESGIDRGCPMVICLDAPIARVVALLAAMVAGAVPSPVEPGLSDTWASVALADARAVITVTRQRGQFTDPGLLVLCLDAERAAIDARSAELVPCPAEPDDAALRLPGRAGQRVALTHRALVGVFASVDDVIEQRDGVWMTLSPPGAPATIIDTLWALSRGYEVVLMPAAPSRAPALSVALSAPHPAMLEAVARFADGHGLDGLWLLEEGVAAARLPDAAVAVAAAAAWTERLPIRAVTRFGIDPARAFEIWRMLHGLAAGRLEVAVMAERPRRLPTILGNLTAIGPKDVPGLPCVLALHPDRFALAGKLGVGVVTVQASVTAGEIGHATAVYREAWRDAGHPGSGHVVLIAPALVGESDRAIRSTAQTALARWLRQVSGSGPAVPLDTIAICGDVRRAAAWIAQTADAGIDEIVCLLDFGLSPGTVRAHLDGIAALHRALRADEPTVAELLADHGVTHLEAPVTAIRRLLAEDATLAALAEVRHVTLTGEPLAADFARAIRHAVADGTRVTRRYAPAEAGTWCTTHPITGDASPVPLGRPLGHARVEVVDPRGQPVPMGAPGELCIGAVDIVPAADGDARLLPRDEGALMRSGLRVRQTADGVIEPAPRATLPPTEPPAPEPPRVIGAGPTEQRIVEAFWTALRQPVADLDDELLDRIDRAIDLVNLLDALRDVLGRPVPLALLFTHRSARAIAEWADTKAPTAVKPRWRKQTRRGRRRK